MDDDTKATLKDARKSFKEKDYKNVLKKCKKVLKKEKDNYAALVLLAAAMNELEEYKEQILMPLQKAVTIEPQNPIGWQGLVSYYEKDTVKTEDDMEKLLIAYCKVLEFNSNVRGSDIAKKISELCLRIKDPVLVEEAIMTLKKFRDISDRENANFLDKMLAWILTEHVINMDKYQDILKTVLISVIQDTDVVNRQDYYRQYLNTLYKSKEYDCLITKAIEMHEQFPQDSVPLKYICKVYYEQSILSENILKINISQFYDELLKLHPESQSAALAKALHLKSTNNLIEAREVLNHVIVAKPESVFAWVQLSEIYTNLSCYEDVENAAKFVLQYGKDSLPENILYKSKILLADAMSRSSSKQKLETAANLCEQLMVKSTSKKLQVIHARTSVFLSTPDVNTELNELESNPETKVDAAILRALYFKNQKQLEEAALLLDTALETSEGWLILGEIYWDMAEYNRSLMAFLNGVKTDCFNWQCLVHLGHYYREHAGDLERSRRCFKAALQINPNSEQAGIGLSTAYRLLKNQDTNMQLLQRLTMHNSGPKWAWLQLGLQYLDQGDAVLAIKAFQYVIRVDPMNSHSWESLADAYFTRGAYTAALRSYQRTLELRPDSLYASIQLAIIKSIIGQYNEAKDDFQLILADKPHYLPALKGLAEVCFCIAKENITNHFYGRARRNLQCALDNLIDAAAENSEFSCIWKLLGDVLYKAAHMSDKYCYLSVPSAFVNATEDDEFTIIKRRDILLLCQRSYSRALALCQNSALLWHDLAACYFARLKLDRTASQKDLTDKCVAIAKYAIKLCPTSCIHWNFLGVICMSKYYKNYALAQHCFVTAIDKEPNNAMIWSNLGTLYLHIGNIYKANEAYSQAQHSDPAYINSWAGQSLIAEKVGRKEAMDLFRHSIQLGYHDEAAIGYSHYVLSLLFSPDAKKDSLYVYMMKNMHAVPLATDVLNWYIERHPENVYARNSYGLLLERQQLYRTAEEQFSLALKNSTSTSERYSISVNLGRVLIQLGKYMDAVELYRSIKTATFKLNCHLALGLFKAEQYEESYETFEAALQWLADSDSDKANTLCAMAAMAYSFQGPEDAKTLLFQCIQMQQPIIPALLAAAALGILHGDWNLTMLVLKELKAYENHNEYGSRIVNLGAYFHLIQNKMDHAITYLCNAVHRYPYDTRYWVKLLRILVEFDSTSFYKCAQKVLFLDRNTIHTEIIHIACALALSPVQSITDRAKLSEKIVFTYPYSTKAWSCFITANAPSFLKNSQAPIHWLLRLVKVVEESFLPTVECAEWLEIVKKKITAYVE